MKYSRDIKLIADVTLIRNNKVLLVKYTDTNKYDHQQGWFIPDDLVSDMEHPDDSANRILKEQLGIENLEPWISFVESFIGNDKTWHIVFHYIINLQNDFAINPSTDIKETEWFNLNSLPDKKETAHHGWAIHTINRIINN